MPDMTVRILVGASHAYACINTPNGSLDQRLEHGKSAKASLLNSAKEEREHAARLIARAEVLELASTVV